MKILHIQRMSTEDGPGLRTTVFVKGCPLKCQWCHNPESIPSSFQKEWIAVRCLRCGLCVANCPQGALQMTPDGISADPGKCTMCQACVEACPTQAMSPIGMEITPEKLFREIVKDKAYFDGQGGITLSGGEILSQANEALTLCKMLKKDQIHVALDTSGFAPYSQFEKLIPYVDLVLYDLKLMDSEAHKIHCGVDNHLIKDNLIRLSKAGVKLWIRTPIIPGATDGMENIRAIATFLRANEIVFDRWELCAFNNLCRDKYLRLGLDWMYANTPLETKEWMIQLTNEAQKIIGNSNHVGYTGVTRMKEEIPCIKK